MADMDDLETMDVNNEEEGKVVGGTGPSEEQSRRDAIIAKTREERRKREAEAAAASAPKKITQARETAGPDYTPPPRPATPKKVVRAAAEDTTSDLGYKETNPNAKPAPVQTMEERIAEARETMNRVLTAPEGYIEARLSTRGKVSACPESFYIRNFMPEDLIAMSTTSENDMPLKIIDILDSMIWNPPGTKEPISVKYFTRKEVIETLLLLYETFYTPIFPGQTWDLTDEDYEFLAERHGGKDSAAYRDRIRALETGEWKPTFDLDISKLDYYEVPDDFKKNVRVSRKVAGKPFTIVFSLPLYGDFVTLKFFIDEIYAKEDRRWAQVAEIIKNREDAKERLRKGENISLRSVPDVPENERKEYMKYVDEKTTFAMTATKALYIKEFDGEDISHLPLEEKIRYARDARVDYTVFQQAQTLFDKMEYGYKEEITAYDPILEKNVSRNYTFQLSDLLQAISNPGDIEVDISLE